MENRIYYTKLKVKYYRNAGAGLYQRQCYIEYFVNNTILNNDILNPVYLHLKKFLEVFSFIRKAQGGN